MERTQALSPLKLLFGSSNDQDAWSEKITDLFPAIIYVYDADSKKLKYINRQVTDILGYTYDDVNAWDDDLKHMVFAEDFDLVKQELEKYDSLNNEETYSYNSRLNNKQGDWRYFRTMGTVLRRSDITGKASSVLFVAQDITSEIQAGQQLKHVEEKMRDLNRSNKELEEFAYIASHDMNEPLRKITTFIERLENRYKGELGAEGQLYLSRITASVDNMRLLIDTLLEFSRTARTNQPFEMTDLNKLVNEAISDLELKIEETNTTIDAGQLPAIQSIPSEIKQLFMNLLTNSIKFRKKDSHPHISIRSEKLSKKLKEQFQLPIDKTYYQLNISDNGIGFETAYNERIFQIFQRLHGKAEYPGSGIGLAICKKIVDHHNGVIYASGQEGRGATFTVILPEEQ